MDNLSKYTTSIRIIVKYFTENETEMEENEVTDKVNQEIEIKKLLSDFFGIIGQKGFLLMIGIRSCNKSTFDIPPKREKLVSEFNKPYSKKSKLTVGARAVMKHSDRSKDKKAWGAVSGTEEDRNVNSNLICLDIMAKATWISLFEISSTMKIVEIRNSEGFGLRWEYNSYTSINFIGLVEPQYEQSKRNIKEKEKKNEGNNETKSSSSDSE